MTTTETVPDEGTDETQNAEQTAAPPAAEPAASPEPATFPRAYVVKLRQESAQYRTRAQQADDLAARLHTTLVVATGRLADPSDLPYDEAHLADDDAMTAAIDDLIARKPHLASRRPTGEVGQGASASPDVVNLAGMLKQRAG